MAGVVLLPVSGDPHDKSCHERDEAEDRHSDLRGRKRCVHLRTTERSIASFVWLCDVKEGHSLMIVLLGSVSQGGYFWPRQMQPGETGKLVIPLLQVEG